VSRAKNKYLILMYERKVDHTTKGKGLVSDFTLKEIQQLYFKNGL
jgi:hypothetical protein